MTTHNDNDLQRRLADPRECRTAFAEVVAQYSEPLYWKVRRIVLNHDDANDIMQNVFLKAWNSLGDFQSRSKVSTWLYRIAINEALDFVRHQKKRQGVSAD